MQVAAAGARLARGADVPDPAVATARAPQAGAVVPDLAARLFFMVLARLTASTLRHPHSFFLHSTLASMPVPNAARHSCLRHLRGAPCATPRPLRRARLQTAAFKLIIRSVQFSNSLRVKAGAQFGSTKGSGWKPQLRLDTRLE